jgi:hypothetical protein
LIWMIFVLGNQFLCQGRHPMANTLTTFYGVVV